MARASSVGVAGPLVLDARGEAALAGARRRARRRNLTGYLFIAPWLFGFFAFTFLPIAGSALLAFTDYNILSQTLHWIGLDNFNKMLFNDQRFWRAVRATFFYALLAVPLKLVFALALAMLLNNTRRLVSVMSTEPRTLT